MACILYINESLGKSFGVIRVQQNPVDAVTDSSLVFSFSFLSIKLSEIVLTTNYGSVFNGLAGTDNVKLRTRQKIYSVLIFLFCFN